MAELLIIADDLTGAIDAGVQLGKHHIGVVVVTDSSIDLKPVLKRKNITALVVNTESRHLLTEEAANRISKIMQSAKDYRLKWFYKKTDSTMRGNIGGELEAFMKDSNQYILPYIPAHPRAKRYTRDGYQFIDDILLHHTSFAHDPHEPIKGSFVPDILKEQSQIDILLSDPAGISTDKPFGENRKIIVFNCHSEADLKTIGETILKNNWQKRIAGTAGFVEILPGLLSIKSHRLDLEPIKGPVLFVNGSLNPVSLEQVSYANEYGVKTVFLTQNLISSPDFKTTDDYKQLIRKIRTELENEKHIVISTTDLIHPLKSSDLAEKNVKPFSEQSGRILAAILNEIRLSALCVFGGDTLMGIIKQAGGKYIEPKNEILPGVAFSKASIRQGTIYLLSKPGGYGEKNEILKIINYIKHSGK